ncbi:CDP-glycerol glycerophosphotransferase family protein [Enterococcus gallinarum]|uniref:CDP-glycerol glycerophosphotransferase family protein n=1 Tax=Enterococcus gallinarum TaxID=1353 RepID=UPI0020A656BB|nr:CDP-glycerol glycerophosphotransferase family protein [Enterococcus gallinarum]
MKTIGIIGYDLFGTGGTTRSNTNLINEFLADNKEIIYFNLLPFSNSKMRKVKEALVNPTRIRFLQLKDFWESDKADTYIITRESLFIFAKIIKQRYPEAKVIGEVHTPLQLIDPEVDFASGAIDTYRVATVKIKNILQKRFSHNNIVVFPVSIRHLSNKIRNNLNSLKEIDGEVNFIIYSRFDEAQKDIAYSIKLMDYLVNQKGKNHYKLYINGTGSGESLYRKLIEMYELNRNVFLNQSPPEKGIYLSTARCETLGYSIIEAFTDGRPIILYKGDDNSLKEIYQGFTSFCWLEKNIVADAEKIIQFINKKYIEKLRQFEHDITLIERLSPTIDYGKKYEKIVLSEPLVNKQTFKLDTDEIYQLIYKQNNLTKDSFSLRIYLRLKEMRFIGPIVSSMKIKETLKRILRQTEATPINDILLKGNLRNDFVFVESFHGKSFAGDPKYLALALKEKFPEYTFYVSSINELVDMEIFSHGMVPVRLGGNKYVTKFRKSRLVIVNGNSLDKAGKVEGQVFVETWHGVPLKKMVADLVDSKQREIEVEAFLPRMKKWDYLLTSSPKNLELFESAFQLKNNEQLAILKNGAPRNAFLMRNRENQEVKNELLGKYFNFKFETGKKYILYCPTWRKQRRDAVSQLDFVKVLDRLPNEYELIVKLHPLESTLISYYNNLDRRIHCFFNEISDIQELYLIADVLITDYSSAMFDFAHLDRKIIVLQEDATDYSKHVGWYFNLKTVTGLEGKAYTEDELVSEIKTEDDKTYNQKIIQHLLLWDVEDAEINIIEQLKIGWNS